MGNALVFGMKQVAYETIVHLLDVRRYLTLGFKSIEGRQIIQVIERWL